MAIAFDAASDGGNNGGGGGSLTWAHTCTGSNRLLIVAAKGAETGGNNITGATYNGVAMSFETFEDPGNRYLNLFFLEAPASGTHNVVVSATGDYILAGAVSYTGCAQTGQPDAVNQTHVFSVLYGSITLSATSGTDNCWGVMAFGGYAGNFPPNAVSGVMRTFDATFGTWGLLDTNAPVTPAGSVTLTADYSPVAITLDTNAILIAISPAGGAVTATWPGYQSPFGWS